MLKKLGRVFLLFLLSAIVFSLAFQSNVKGSQASKSAQDSLTIFYNRCNSSLRHVATSSAPSYQETSEYLIGSSVVGVVFLESNGTIDQNTEDWTQEEQSNVVNKIQDALNWWPNQNPSASVSFTLATVNYGVPTSYEPINRPYSDDRLWISEAMNYIGYKGNDYLTQVRNYINDLRNNALTNWAFALFVVDSSNDVDGKFADGQYSAYTHAVGGPFVVMTYTNDGWGIQDMNRVFAHEIGHVYYATDEYDNRPENSGYLDVRDNDGSQALMDNNNLVLSEGTKGQIGWLDTDGDSILDILDTFPDTTLNQFTPDPTDQSSLTYTGTVREVPLQNKNPQIPAATRRDVTINKITKVEFRIDGGAWQDAFADDGTFDEDEEAFSFTVSLANSTHVIEARGTNSVGNVETTLARDEVTCVLAPSFGLPPEIVVVVAVIFVVVVVVTATFFVLRMKNRQVTALPLPPPPPPPPPPI